MSPPVSDLGRTGAFPTPARALRCLHRSPTPTRSPISTCEDTNVSVEILTQYQHAA
jgi:hypothetical protein